MRERVPEVQDRAHPTLALIRRNDIRFDLTRSSDRIARSPAGSLASSAARIARAPKSKNSASAMTPYFSTSASPARELAVG